MSPEFQLIHDYFNREQTADHSVLLGIGDDCALLQCSDNTALAISVDTSIADRHFPIDAPANLIAARALNISLSDLAAMGATPRWFTLAISLPKMDTPWLKSFSQGLFQAANAAGVQLIGGDTTKSELLSITIQVHGEINPSLALRRDQAKIGDFIYVSGNLGHAAAGLSQYQQGIKQEPYYSAFLNPQPQLALGQKLLGLSHCAIDISDGLLADLNHILKASKLGAEIDCARLPLAELSQWPDKKQAFNWALTGGDDYQLCFTSAYTPEEIAAQGVQAAHIGQIVAGNSVSLHNLPHGLSINTLGFDHFYETSI